MRQIGILRKNGGLVMPLKKAAFRRILGFLLTAILIFSVFAPVGAETEEKLKAMSDFIGKKIAMVSGAAFDAHLQRNDVLQGRVEIQYLNSMVDCISSVISGKSDALMTDKPVAEGIVGNHPELMVFPEIVMNDAYGIGFQKGNTLVSAFNEAMDRLMAQGLDDELTAKWMGTDDAAKQVIPQDWEGENGTLRYWLDASTPPMAYLGPEGTPIGYTVDLMLHIAREMGYNVELTECTFDGLIPAVQGGRADLAGSSMSITEERREKIDFSKPIYTGGSVLVVRKANVDETLLSADGAGDGTDSGEKGLFQSIADSFNKTFIQENRWEVFLTGLLNTLLITFSSMLLGCLLGFGLFLLCRKTGKTVRSIVQAITGIIVGIPAVVLLMVLFYVIFGTSAITGIVVSIIAFTLTFGTSVLGMLETGCSAVDYGQTEGAYALGFGDNATFFRVVFPQALMHILPIFKGELTSLLKATAVVGYIAVQDLTRAGDIIRNRTFEAFFSLISVAVIYYVIGKLLGALVSWIQRAIDPCRRKPEKILKGVNEHV